MKRTLPLLTFGAIAAIYLATLLTSAHAVDGDEAVVGIMAKHILTRGEMPVFFLGQPYNGGAAILAWLSTIPFAIFGMSGIAFKSVGLVLWCAGLALTYRFCVRFFTPRAAFLSVLLFAVATPLREWPVSMRSGYVGLPLVSIAMLFVFARIAFRPGPARDDASATRGSAVDVLLLGLLSGLAYYNLELIAPLIVVLFLSSLFWRRAFWNVRQVVFVCVGALTGLAPLIYYNLTHEFANIRFILGRTLYARGASTDVPGAALFLEHLPAFFVGRNFDRYVSSVSTAAYVEYAAYAALFVVAVTAHIAARWRSAPGDRRLNLQSVLIAYVIVELVANAMSAGTSVSPRYLLPLFPVLAVVVGVSFDGWFQASRRLPRLVAALALGVLVSLGVMSRISYITSNSVNDDVLVSTETKPKIVNTPTQAGSVPAIITYLEASGISRVRCTYFLQWRLMFESDERIIASSDGLEPGVNRYPLYDELVRNADRHAFVFHRLDVRLDEFRRSGEAPRYTQHGVAEYVVFTPRW